MECKLCSLAIFSTDASSTPDTRLISLPDEQDTFKSAFDASNVKTFGKCSRYKFHNMCHDVTWQRSPCCRMKDMAHLTFSI
eukprot:jgi/Picre1/32845/NNA_008174.t1